MQAHFEPDHPTLDERLGRVELLRQVVSHILKVQPPCVIGIHGDWGSGKTSFLMQLEYLLTNGKQRLGVASQKPPSKRIIERLSSIPIAATHPVVWFEAWRYQHDPQPVTTLLREIRKQLSPTSRAWLKIRGKSAVMLETALLGIDEVSKHVGVRASLKEYRSISEQRDAASFSTPSPTVSLTDVLNHAIKQVLSSYGFMGDPRLIVLIDDLDRCDPEMARNLLEGLKIYLNLPDVVFVIAMDETVVEEYIAKQLFPSNADDDSAEAARRARQYLEKLCQSIYRLPFAPQPEELFLDFLSELKVSPSALTHLRAAFGSKDVVPPNPRKIRHLAEVTARLLAKVQSTMIAEPARARTLATLSYILAYMHHFEPALYRLAERYGSAFFQDFLIPSCEGSSSIPELGAGVRILLPPAASSAGPSFVDPIRSGVFYPAPLLVELTVIPDDIQQLLH